MENKIPLNTLIRIQLAFGAGSKRGYNLYNKLREGKPVDKKDSAKLSEIDDALVQKVKDDCQKGEIRILSIEDDGYPDNLRNIDTPALILYIKGNLPDFDSMPAITVVGPRKISDFGKKAAYSLALRLAKGGIIIVSGAALGADSFAHKGALDAGGVTVALLGCGILYDYLPENRKLRADISKSGCLISEHPPYAPTTRYSFPVRNRLLSALTLSTAVIEAGEKSGALVTARHALEQGKDIFVIPGNPSLPQYKGSNLLLRDGAHPLIDASDIFNLYLPRYLEKISLQNAFGKKTQKECENKSKKLNISLSNEAKMLYNSIVKNKFTADDFSSLDLSDDLVLSALTELEIEGLIKSLAGGFYELN